jgi:hypothetical protein
MMHHPGSNDYYSYSPNGDNKTLQTQQPLYQEKGKEVSNVNSNVIQKKPTFLSDNNISFQNTQHSQREIKTNVAFPRVNRQTTFLPPNRSFPPANRPEQPRK